MKKARTLGLLAIMALALSATIGAASASASSFVAGKYSAVVTGTPGASHTITTPAGVLNTCAGSTFSLELGGATEALTPGAMSDSSCTRSGSATALKMNGCKFIYRPGAETSPGNFNGTFDIGPAGCGPIKLEEPAFSCTKLIGAQSGFAATYKNIGSGEGRYVKVSAAGGSIKYTVEKKVAGVCQEGTVNYLGDWNVSATSGGVSTALFVATHPPVGIYLSGSTLNAEKYPTTLTGSQASEAGLEIGYAAGQNRKLLCKSVNFDGVASAASSEVSLGAEYSGCQSVLGSTKLAATVAMNSCRYVFHVIGSSAPYTGSMDIACSTPGDSIQINIYNGETKTEGPTFCVQKIPAQSGFTGIGLANIGSGAERGVAASLAVSGIAYTRTGNVSCGLASGTGAYNGGINLFGI